MNFRYQSEDFKSMSMYVYNHWNYKQYVDILPISECWKKILVMHVEFCIANSKILTCRTLWHLCLTKFDILYHPIIFLIQILDQ